MSVDKWAYEPQKCDGEICVGDCDLCQKAKTSPSNVWMKIGEHIGEIMNLLFEASEGITAGMIAEEVRSTKMTNEEARKIIKLFRDREGNSSDDIEAFDMAIKALEQISHLIDRPCGACEFYKEKGCCKWVCVFEEDKE